MIKLIHSDMPGAPVLSGLPGALAGVLDASGVTGFNNQQLTSLTVTGGVATAVKAGHGYGMDYIVAIAGATPAALNGEHAVTWSDSNSFRFDAAGVSDCVATGTITCKVAPIGLSTAFTATNKRAYQLGAGSTGMLLRVDDAGTGRDCSIRGYEVMTDIDTGTGPFPTTAQGGVYWYKSVTTDTTARKWVIVGDSHGFWFLSQWNVYEPTAYSGGYFGDIASWKSADQFRAAVSGFSTNAGGWAYQDYLGSVSANGATLGHYLARATTGVGSAVTFSKTSILSAYTYSGFNTAGNHPEQNPADNGIVVAPMLAVEGATLGFRGVIPGLYFLPQRSTASSLTRISEVSGLEGRQVVILEVGASGATSRIAIDVTGPWR